MNFLNDYLFYNEGNEADRQYHLWSALTLLSVVIGRRVYFRESGNNTYKQLIFRPNIQVCLVGVQGNGKSFAKDGMRNILTSEFPHIPLSPSVDTIPALTKRCGQPEARRTFTTTTGEIIEYTPITLVINELKNYISRDPTGTVDFIVDCSDREDKYDVKTKNKGEDDIIAPYLTMLGCATTEYIVDQLRDKVLSGGLSRRVIFVNVIKERVPKKKNEIPPGGQEALARAIAHLHSLEGISGEFKWASEADWDYAATWKVTQVLPRDPLMAGFARTMFTQALKISMLLALGEYEVKLLLTKQHFGKALLFLQEILPNMERLFLGAGRNVLSVPMQHIVDMIEQNGGMMPEKDVRRIAGKDLQPFELASVLEHLRTTDQVVMAKVKDKNQVERLMLLTKRKAEELG